MRELPPDRLVALLTRLGLATERELERVETAVHRLAGDLPRFESVWIDALRQARILTHFQAAEIHAGRGEALAVARYVLCQPVHECGYAAVYRAEDRQTQETVRLAVCSSKADRPHADPLPEGEGNQLANLEKLIAVGKGLPPQAGIIVAGGLDGSRYWAASPWVEGASLADFVLHHGRFPPEAVLEIARAMLGELVALEAAGLVQGDVRMQTVLIAGDGEVHIPHPGLRRIFRPQEETSCLDLAPDACNVRAPERVTDGTPPTVASDLFACGCVWWHLLCGRPPQHGGTACPGGDTQSHLRATQTAAVDDLHQWATDVPDVLAEAIGECLQKDPRKRPRSMSELAQRLGPLRRRGRQVIARCLIAAAEPRAPWLRSKPIQGKKVTHPHRLTAASLALLAAVAVAWPLWVARNRPQGAGGAPAQRVGKQGAVPSTHHAPRDEIHYAERDEYTSPRPIVDPAVTPAGYADASALLAPRSPLPAPEELRLPADRPVRGDSLQFKPGERVRAEGGRARIVVPRAGLAVQADRVSFENIDFVPEERVDRRAIGDETPGALIRLAATECDFTDCSFQSDRGSPELRAAIVWQPASSERPAAVSLPSGRIRMKNCVFRRVAAGIESRVHGAVSLEIENSLCLGPGPMIRLTHAPAADEPVRIRLAQVTLREADALLDCRGNDRPAGEINIEAAGCVLAPRARAALLLLTADADHGYVAGTTYSWSAGSLLHEVQWTGQGSVLAGQVVFGQWCGRDGARQTIDDATLSIAGLVRGEVEFAGNFDGQPANSRVVNSQSPLRDTDSAGAAVGDLPPDVEEK